MRICVVGSGAREHALAVALGRNAEVVVTPGNAGMAAKVLGLFVTDIPADELSALTARAYAPGVFDSEQVVPVKELEPGFSLLGLSQGPTLAFKDMAMQFLGQVFEYVLTQRNSTLNIVGATSGDTGSAAEYALRGKRGVSVERRHGARGDLYPGRVRRRAARGQAGRSPRRCRRAPRGAG